MRLRLSQPSLAGAWAGAELGNIFLSRIYLDFEKLFRPGNSNQKKNSEK